LLNKNSGNSDSEETNPSKNKNRKKSLTRKESNKENQSRKDPELAKFSKLFCVGSVWIGICNYVSEEQDVMFELTINAIEKDMIKGVSVWPNLKAKSHVSGRYFLSKDILVFKDKEILEGDIKQNVTYKFENFQNSAESLRGTISDGENGTIILYPQKEYQMQEKMIMIRKNSVIDSDSEEVSDLSGEFVPAKKDTTSNISEIKQTATALSMPLYLESLDIGKSFMGNYKELDKDYPFTFYVSNRNGNKIFGHITWLLTSKKHNFAGEIDGENIKWDEYINDSLTGVPRTYIGKISNENTEIKGKVKSNDKHFEFNMNLSYIDIDAEERSEEEKEESTSVTVLSSSNYKGVFLNMHFPFNLHITENVDGNIFGSITFPFYDSPLPFSGKISGEKISFLSIGNYDSLITEGSLTTQKMNDKYLGASFLLQTSS